MNLLFASQNPYKIAEIQAKLPEFTIEGLSAKLFPNELQETGLTLKDNALQKASQVYKVTKQSCFADDTGLLVDSLNGEPGVYSARYAGEQKNSEDNMDLLLKKLVNSSNRKAKFVTVIALILNGKEYFFEGECKGEITYKKGGRKGFGYDPIFKPTGYNKTFAEMTMDEKSTISHRGLAVEKLVAFLNMNNL